MVGLAESLNVGVAGGVLMYLWLQAHLADGSGIHRRGQGRKGIL